MHSRYPPRGMPSYVRVATIPACWYRSWFDASGPVGGPVDQINEVRMAIGAVRRTAVALGGRAGLVASAAGCSMLPGIRLFQLAHARTPGATGRLRGPGRRGPAVHGGQERPVRRGRAEDRAGAGEQRPGRDQATGQRPARRRVSPRTSAFFKAEAGGAQLELQARPTRPATNRWRWSRCPRWLQHRSPSRRRRSPSTPTTTWAC